MGEAERRERGSDAGHEGPEPKDTVTVRRVLLDGLAREADIFEQVNELAPLHPRTNTFPAGCSSTSPRTR